MSWDFFVPVCLGDLVKTGGINQYVVQDVASPKQLPSYLSSKHRTWTSSGSGLSQPAHLFRRVFAT